MMLTPGRLTDGPGHVQPTKFCGVHQVIHKEVLRNPDNMVRWPRLVPLILSLAKVVAPLSIETDRVTWWLRSGLDSRASM